MLLRPLGHATADEGTAPAPDFLAHDGAVPSASVVPFRELRDIGQFFSLSPTPLATGRDVTGLLEDPSAAIDLYADRLSTARRDIAGSLFLQGWASRVGSIHLGCLALADGVPDLGPANLTYRLPDAGPVELALRDPGLHPAEGAWAALVDRHLGPLVEAVDEACGPGARRLWGNVASALAGALVMLRRKGVAAAVDLPAELADFGDWTGTRYRRRTCCNLFRVDGYGLCGDCVILRERR